MNLLCQSDCIEKLDDFANRQLHSTLISGPPGSGKTYLALQYAKKLGVYNFQVVEPNVSSIRSAIDTCYELNTPIVICIENLDLGVPAASYTLLKFLEEPNSLIYIVVTVRNLSKVIDTIISRSAVAEIQNPYESDINIVASTKDIEKFNRLSQMPIWKAVKTFKDVDTVFNMSPVQISYIQGINNMMSFRDNVSNIVWSLGHYEDNTETPATFVLQYMMTLVKSRHLQQCIDSCLQDLSQNRVAAHAAIAKLVLDCKYTE